MPLPTTNEIDALAKLISDSVTVVTTEYAKARYAEPSLHNTKPDPFHSPELVSDRLKTAIKTIEAACAQLSATVVNPGHVIVNKAYAYMEPVLMRIAVDLRIADHLLDRPDGLHVEELSKLSDQDSGKLSRVLRMLATNHIFIEVSPNVFANNRLSMKLRSTDPVSSLVGHISDESMKACVQLGDVFEDPAKRKSYQLEDSSFYLTHGVNPFEYFDMPRKEKVLERFNQAMVGWAEVTGKAMLPKLYAWDRLPVNSVVVDVGGGNGHAVLPLLKAYSTLNVVVQDTPSVVEQGREYWEKEYPEALKNRRVSFVSLDFLKESPVTGGAVYYLRHVLHDWPDAQCLEILKNIRKVTQPGCKLLINEFVLHSTVQGSGVETQAPWPLLPNYGAANKRPYQQDINMMNQFNSKERTLDEFIDLGELSGFEFVKLWDGGEVGLVEFVPSL
ncbi:hypothetical protein ONZ45_g13265 [Pleurotus djamor]|nr:hypothetical protein ONZ45_g13265 [Pleurotus djamor]